MAKRKLDSSLTDLTKVKVRKTKDNTESPSEKKIQGILKTPVRKVKESAQSCGSSTPGSPNKSVHFKPPEKLKKTLHGIYSGDLDRSEIEDVLSNIESLKGQTLILWLQEFQVNISLFDIKLENFVAEILKISWTTQGEDVVEAFKGFVVNLVSAQSVYAKIVIRSLLKNFSTSSTVCVEKKAGEFSEVEKTIFSSTHLVLEALLKVAPALAKEEILSQVERSFPFVKSNAHKQACYVSAVIHMTTYLEEGSEKLLQILIERLVKLDVHCPRSDLEDDSDMDSEEKETLPDNASVNNIAISLDVYMSLMFKHIKDETHSQDGVYQPHKGKALYKDMMKIYESHVLKSFQIAHTQFLYFYLAGLDPNVLGHQFIKTNWFLFTNPNTASIHRQTAIAYIASFVSRAEYITISTTKACLEKLTSFIHSYIRDSNVSHSTDFMYTNLQSHGPFYAACQAAFYIFAFRHKELVADPVSLKFCKSLGFNSIVTSQLNPLRVCLPGVVRNFSSIARNYQLAYCQTVMERNNRINLPIVGSLSSANTTGKPLLLDCFFPFDPYLLPCSKHWVDDMYREYHGDEDDDSEEEGEEEEEEEDKRTRHDSLDSVRTTRSRTRSDSVNIPDFMLYETMPGFKKI